MIGLKPCPFCGSTPKRWVNHEVLHIECPSCVSVGFHNHVRFGCRADGEWNTRAEYPIKAELVDSIDHDKLDMELRGINLKTMADR